MLTVSALLCRNVVERGRKHFAECGPEAFDHLYNLRHQEALFITEQGDEINFESQENLLTHSINVLFGLPSKSFVFNKVSTSLHLDLIYFYIRGPNFLCAVRVTAVEYL